MVERKRRLKEVYEHLRQFYGIHTQTDFANAIKYSRVYISAAMNGNENNLTDKLFENICEAYPGVFNLEYLLTGVGGLLVDRETVTTEEIVKNENLMDQAKMFDALLRSKDETIEELRGRVADLKQQVADLRQQVALMTKKEHLELPVESSIKM
jgi:transcriptional regulator with XRE-family HTH domain